MLGLRTEIAAFLMAVLTGMTAVCIYACIRQLRRVIGHSLAAIAVEDGIYWTGIAVYVFVQIYVTSSGSIRWYFVLGVMLGVSAFLLLSGLFRKLRLKWNKKKKSRKSIEVIPKKR